MIQQIDSNQGGGALALLNAIGQHTGRRTRRALTAVAVVQTGVRGMRAWADKGRADEALLGARVSVGLGGASVTPADVVGCFKDHLGDVGLALDALTRLVAARRAGGRVLS